MNKFAAVLVLIVDIAAFYTLILNVSWKFYPIGFLIGLTMAEAIGALMKR